MGYETMDFMPTKRIPYWRWVEDFKPIANPFEKNAMCDGFVFLDIGAADKFVRAQKIEHVWTLTTEDRPRSVLWSIGEGMHTINRAGYLISAVPWSSKHTYYIKY